ncbi:MAG: superoxide dismutase [Saprospiraceae bacterium]|nr:superoxide dismutase [Saprospiraceae bacterium]
MKHVSIVVFALIVIFGGSVTAQPFSLPKLNYSYDALEPYIDAQTMEIHYSKHHQGYLNNLNKAVANTNFADWTIEELMLNAEKRSPAVRNNAGGFYNHALFWEILSPNAQKTPKGQLADEINRTFTSLDSLKRLMNNQAATRFGSGWVWLYVNTDKKLAVCSSPNQDNPIMDVMKGNRGIPVLGIDVWEHAYYLKYQNKRGDYLNAIWNVVDWDTVNKKYEAALKDPFLKVIEKNTWEALKNFHAVMAQTFHPMEDGDFNPIRQRSSEMLDKAKLLSTSPAPNSFKTVQITNAIKELVDGAQSLDKLVKKKAKNDKIEASLTKLHDVFHKIQGLCSNEDH